MLFSNLKDRRRGGREDKKEADENDGKTEWEFKRFPLYLVPFWAVGLFHNKHASLKNIFLMKERRKEEKKERVEIKDF